MTTMTPLFGTDGVRGKANHYPLDADTALVIGRAVATYFKSATRINKAHIAIGQDTRISGDMLAHAVAAGICSTGVDVYLLGILPTSGIAHVASKIGAVAAIVISASHNPFEDNGIKVFDGKGFKPDDDAQMAIERLIADSDGYKPTEKQRIGWVRTQSDPVDQYIAFLKKAAPQQPFKGLRIALDCANGATYRCAPQLFKKLGADIIALSCDPNGININADCGSQYPEALAAAVVEHRADLGLAFDGDGDRLIAVDEIGQVLSGDHIMAICAKHLLDTGRLKNNQVVATVMSNLGFHHAMSKLGIRVHTTPVGDRHVMAKMLAEDAVLGGEDSGHMIFRDYHTTGDGLVAALQLIGVMLSTCQPLSELAKIMSVYPQILINVNVKTKPDISTIPPIVDAIQTAESTLGDQGRVLVRYSGTQNQCRVMVEGPTRDMVQSLCSGIAETVSRCIG